MGARLAAPPQQCRQSRIVLLLSQRGQGCFRAGVGFHIIGNVPQDSFFINDEMAAVNTHVGLAKISLFSPDTVSLRDAMIFVDQQGEGQIVLLAKLSVALGIVRADTQNDSILGADLIVFLAEPASLNRSARGVVFGVEIEDNLLPPVVG